MEELLRVGVITASHGIKGEVKVFPTTDGPERFKKLKQVILKTDKEEKTLQVEHCKTFKQYAILKFEGYDKIEDIEKYRGAELWVKRLYAQKLAKNEYYVADLLGIKVFTEDMEELGEIRDVLETGANDVYEITLKNPAKYGNQETLLIPAIKECILEVELEKREMKIHLMDGLV